MGGLGGAVCALSVLGLLATVHQSKVSPTLTVVHMTQPLRLAGKGDVLKLLPLYRELSGFFRNASIHLMWPIWVSGGDVQLEGERVLVSQRGFFWYVANWGGFKLGCMLSTGCYRHGENSATRT